MYGNSFFVPVTGQIYCIGYIITVTVNCQQCKHECISLCFPPPAVWTWGCIQRQDYPVELERDGVKWSGHGHVLEAGQQWLQQQSSWPPDHLPKHPSKGSYRTLALQLRQEHLDAVLRGCGREGVSLLTANNVDVRGVFLLPANNVDVRVYPFRRTLWGCAGQRWAKWRLSTFDLYPGGEGHRVQGQICDILRSQLSMNRFLPLLATDSHTLYTYIWGGGGCLRRALKLDRCRAFDLFASVDAHLCTAGCIPLRRQQYRRPGCILLHPHTMFLNAGMPDCTASGQSSTGIN